MDRLTDIESRLLVEADDTLVGVVVEYAEFTDSGVTLDLTDVVAAVDRVAPGVGWLIRRPDSTALGGHRWADVSVDGRRHVLALSVRDAGGTVAAALAEVAASPFPPGRARWDVWILEDLPAGGTGLAVRYDLSAAPDVAHQPLAAVLFGAGVWPLLPDRVDEPVDAGESTGGGLGDLGSAAQMLVDAVSSPTGLSRLLGSVADLVESVVDRVVGEPEPEAAPPQVSCELVTTGAPVGEVAGAIVRAFGAGQAREIGGAAEGLSMTPLAREVAPDRRDRIAILVDTVVGPQQLFGEDLAGLWVLGPVLGAGTDTVTVTSVGEATCVAQLASGSTPTARMSRVLASVDAAGPTGEPDSVGAGVAEKSPAKKTAAKKTSAEKSPAKKTAAKKTSAEKSPAKKTAAKKTSAKKTAAKKTAAKKTAAKKSGAKKTAAEKSGAKKSAAKKSPAKKAGAKKSAAKKSGAKKTAAKKSGAKKSAAKKSPAKKAGAKKGAAKKAGAKKSPAAGVKAPPARKRAPRRR